MLKIIVATTISLGALQALGDQNVFSVSIGRFTYEQQGTKAYTATNGEVGTLAWNNRYSQTSLQLNYLRNLGGSVYVGGSVGNNDHISGSIGFGW